MKLNNTCTKDNTPLFRNHQKTNPQLFLNTTWMLLVFLFSFSGITSQLYAADKNGTAKPTYQAFAGNEYYVSPSGTPGGDGSINNPWDLQTALNHPAVIQPGSTIWLKPGTYKGTFISKLTGTASSPILVKAMPGGRAIIDGSRAGQLVKNVNTLQLSGAYTWYSGFEVTNSDPSRVISQSGSNPQERRGEGVYVLGAGIKVINLIIYDTGEGLSCWSSAENNEYYGNVIFNNGWFAPDREHGHGIYAQNNTGTKSYVDNIVLNNFSYGWQFYGSKTAFIKNFYLEGNVMLNDRWLIGGSSPAENIDVNTNFTYKDTVEFGYTNNLVNNGLTLRNNVFSSQVLLSYWRNVTATNNTFYTGYSYGFPITLMFDGPPDVSTFNFNNNTYYWSNPPSPYQAELAINWVNFPLADSDPNRRGNYMLKQWRQMGKDVNSTLKYFPLIDDRNYAISGSSVYVRKNKYDSKRAHVIIYNYDKLDNIPVDVSGILAAGDSYELHNVQNYFGDVIKGTYSGGQLSVPMNNHTVAKPLGYNYELGKNTQKEFGTFVLINTTNAATTPVNVAPIANAGADVTLTLPTNSTSLSGTKSTDAEGAIAGYNWSKISGPAQFTLSATNSSALNVSNLVQGVYTFRLTVTDSQGATATDDVIITVNSAPVINKAPIANAGSNVTIQLPVNAATLDASSSTDTDGSIVSFSWAKISGPTQFTISSLNAASTTVSNLIEGTYGFRVTVVDNSGSTATSDVSVTVNAATVTANKPPIAIAGNDITLQLPVNSTTLNASQSYDPDGSIATYNWSKITGPAQYSAPTPTSSSNLISDLAVGTYTFRLTVTDNKGASTSDDINITVNAAATTIAVNQSPVANAGSDINIQLPTNSANLNASQSSDADGYIFSYTWTKISGPSQFSISSPNTATTTASNLLEGTYVFRVTVTDNGRASNYADVKVIVAAQANKLPTANAGADVTITLPTSSAYLDGSQSKDPDGYIFAYNWTKISGPSQYGASGITTSKLYLSNLVSGSYVFRLTVTDDDRAASSDEVTIRVDAAASPTTSTTPGTSAGDDVTLQLPLNYVYLKSTQTVAPDRYIASYKWTKISGPSQYFITSTNTANTTMNYLVQGTYVFRITVVDNLNQSTSDDIVVNVIPALSNAASGNTLQENQLINSTKIIGLYPNPVTNLVQLKWTNEYTGNATIKIVDINGKTVKSLNIRKENKTYNNTIDVSSLVQGLYMVEIHANHKNYTEKFIKK